MSAFAVSSPLVLGKQGCVAPARSTARHPVCSATGPESNDNRISRRGVIAAAVTAIAATVLSKPNEALAGAFGLPSPRELTSDLPSLGDTKNKFKGIGDDLQGSASDMQKKMQDRKDATIKTGKSAKSTVKDATGKAKDYISGNAPEDKVGKKVKSNVDDAVSKGKKYLSENVSDGKVQNDVPGTIRDNTKNNSQFAADATQDPNYDKKLKGPFDDGVDTETKRLMEKSASVRDDQSVRGIIDDAVETMKK